VVQTGGTTYTFVQNAYMNNGLNQPIPGGSPGFTLATMDIYNLATSILIPVTTVAMTVVPLTTGQSIMVTIQTTMTPLNTVGSFVGEMTALRGVQFVKVQDYFDMVNLSTNPSGDCC